MNAFEQAHRAFANDDAAALRQILAAHPELKALLHEPIKECFGAPPITLARSPAMLDVLIEAGANLNAKSQWWAGGFGLLHTAKPELAHYAIERGARVDIHAAARLGLMDKLRELVAADPQSVNARGGDGQMALHFASTIPIADFLLDHGANIDARDVDHESTPAQWMLDGRQDLARHLIKRGGHADLLMAAALGDMDLARKILDADPAAIRFRVSDEYFPMIGSKNGGTIYQWTLGWHVSPHQVAKKFGHAAMFDFLMARSPAEVRLINFCWLGDEPACRQILASHPNIQSAFQPADLRQPAHAARNNDPAALRLLLAAGLPVTGRSQHRATALHWSAWHGNIEMVRLILAHQPALEDADNDYSGTPLGWAIHGSENAWQKELGDHPATVEALLRAGAKPVDRKDGTPAVRAVLERFA